MNTNEERRLLRVQRQSEMSLVNSLAEVLGADCDHSAWISFGGLCICAAYAGAIERAKADALNDAAAAIYNGAGDPEQEFYDHGVSPWLSQRALKHEFSPGAYYAEKADRP